MKRDVYFEIAAQHSADLQSIRILPSKADRSVPYLGRAIPELGIIIVQRPDTLAKLKRFLHECAHTKIHRRSKHPYHRLELEAEQYALAALAEAGLVIPESLLVDSKNRIYGELLADLRAGFEPAPGVFEYIDFSEAQAEELVTRMRALPRTNKFLHKTEFVAQ